MIELRPYHHQDRPWVEDANLRFYRTEHGFDATFDDELRTALDGLEQQKPAEKWLYLIAEANEQRVGCIFLSADASATGRVRLFYVDAAFRGQGIGKRLLRAVVAKAQEKECRILRVSTFDRHEEACGLYERFGFVPVRSAPVTAFGRSMTQVDFELRLST